MNVHDARGATAAARARMNKEWEAEHEKFMAKQTKEIEARWKERGQMWITKIEGYIKKAAAKGDNYVWEPNTTNPNGSEIIYVGAGDYLIHKKLMEHFRNLGFNVQEYMYGGMKITW